MKCFIFIFGMINLGLALCFWIYLENEQIFHTSVAIFFKNYTNLYVVIRRILRISNF